MGNTTGSWEKVHMYSSLLHIHFQGPTALSGLTFLDILALSKLQMADINVLNWLGFWGFFLAEDCYVSVVIILVGYLYVFPGRQAKCYE